MKSNIEALLADYRAGKMIILMDDEDRENEGDLLISAQIITPEAINFMATYGRGLVCLTLTQQRCEKLKLPLMVNDNRGQYGTNFTLSIEAKQGVTTGISAADRAKTVQVAVDTNSNSDDIVQPGHIFPLMAKNGGVLTRAGHTEAGCDFARLAGFEPASVIVEILNEDGTMARYDDLVAFSKKHDIKLGTIEDLIRYRIENEKNIQQISSKPFTNQYGDFSLLAFEDSIQGGVHLALVKGDISQDKETLVRVHMEDTLNDVLFSNEVKISSNKALKCISKVESAVLLLLRKQTNSSLLHRINKTVEDGTSGDDVKTFGVGAQILNEIGVGKMRVLGSPRKLNALKGFNLEVVGYTQP